MATVVTELAALFGGFGLTNVLIQRRVISRLQLDTIFWAGASIGAVLTLLVFALSFIATWFYSDPLTGELLRVLCFTFLLTGLTNVHEAIIARLMYFKMDFFIQISSIALRAIVAIIFAYSGFGVWSLVAGALTGALVSLICYVSTIRYIPRFRFHSAYIFSNLKTIGSYFGRGILYYADMNIDLILIGRYLGATPLGHYQNARSLTDEVRARIATPLQRILFPAFSALQSEPERLKTSVIRSCRLIAAVIIPAGIGISAISPELVPVLYGSQWLPMIPVVSMFGISTALRGSTTIASQIFNATNHVGLALRFNIVGTFIMVVSVSICLPYGVEAVSIAVVFSSLYSLITFRAAFGLIGLESKHLLTLAPPAIAAATMWLVIYYIRNTGFFAGHNLGFQLIVFVFIGVISYSVTLHSISRQYAGDFTEVFRKLTRR